MSTAAFGVSIAAGNKKKRIRNFRPTLKKPLAATAASTDEPPPPYTNLPLDCNEEDEFTQQAPTVEGFLLTNEYSDDYSNKKDESPVDCTGTFTAASDETQQTGDSSPTTSHLTQTLACMSSRTAIKGVTLRNRKRKSTVLAIGISRGSGIATTGRNSLQGNAVVAHHPKLPPDRVGPVVLGATEPNHDVLDAYDPANEEQCETLKPKSAQRSTNLPLALVPPIIPEDTSGKPKLSAFCSLFPKPKMPRTTRRDRLVVVAPVGAAADDGRTDVGTILSVQQQQQQQQQPHVGPIVQIVNGEIVLQESSVIFHGSGAAATTAAALHQEAAADGTLTEVVEEEAELAIVGATYTSFATGRRVRPRTSHWTAPETQLFYEALRQVGLDFGTMEAFFDNHAAVSPHIHKRLRRQLKNKYQAEHVKHPALVEKALRSEGRVGIDLAIFELTPDSVAEVQANKKKQEQSITIKPEVTANLVRDARDDVVDETGVVISKASEKAVALSIPHADTNENESNQPFSWPDEIDGGEDSASDRNKMHAIDDGVMDDPMAFDDPLFLDDSVTTSNDGGNNDRGILPSMVFGVPKATKKTNKPNFRSAARKRGLGLWK